MAIELGSTAASLGSALGAGFAKPIESALDLLARKKLSDLGIEQENKQRKSQQDYFTEQLQPILGNQYSPELIKYVAGQSPEIQNQLVGSPVALDYLQQMMSGQQNNPLQQLMQPQAQQAQQQPQQGSMYDKLMQMQGAPIQPGQGFGAQVPQQQMQQQPMMQAPQQMQWPNQLAGRQALQQALSKPMTEAQRRQTEAAEQRVELSKEKELTRQQEKLRPIINAEIADHKHIKKIGKLAKSMLKNLEEHKDQFPGWISGIAQDVAQGYITRNPYVRQFRDNGIELASLMTVADKGQPTNYKLKLKQLQKPNIAKPYETNVAELQALVDAADESDLVKKYMDSLKDSKGNYPLDINDKLSTYSDAIEDPLRYPELFPIGMHYVDDEGNESILKMSREGKRWKAING